MNAVIIGAGHAGFHCAAALRQQGFAGAIVMIANEPGLPYQRPPLSKAFLLGKASAAELQFRAADFYEEHRIQRVRGRVEQIDRKAQRVVLTSGESLPYDHLVIATGSQPRKLSVDGHALGGVLNLQTLADADALRERMSSSRRAVVVGAGFIGLEFAAAARTLGLEVSVVDVASRALARAASQESADVLVDAAHANGVEFHFNCGIECLAGANGQVTGVHTADGRVLPAEIVVVGIGAQPSTQLAQQAGLAVDNGIRVDAQLLTSDPHISAIGDVAAFPAPGSGQGMRLESVQNATDQARVVAARLAGKPAAYEAVPWFWSDQGEHKLQIAGLRAAGDEHVVLPGTPGARGQTVLCLRGDRLAAVETIDRPADHMLARRLLAKGVRVSAAQALAPGFELKALA